MKPLLLDLFCGEGGAAMGYHRAGFAVVGVDINPQPNYPFDFIRADAIEYMEEAYDRVWPPIWQAVHASPPCQRWSASTPEHLRDSYPDLITPTRAWCKSMGLPYVIENVPRSPLVAPYVICGSSLGLRVRRHRHFETNFPLLVPPCQHRYQGQPVGVYGEGSSKGQLRGRKADNEAEVLEVMDMPWATRAGATQAIPPAYTQLIGSQLLAHVGVPA